MKPELKARLEAAQKRLADAQAKVAAVGNPDTKKIAELEAKVRALESETRARPIGAPAAAKPNVEVAEPNAKTFSFARALLKSRAKASIFNEQDWDGAENELAALRKGVMERYAPTARSWGEAEPVVKAMSFQDTASAGGLIPVALMSEIIGLNRSLDVLPQLGVTEKTGLVGTVEWNRRTSGTTFRPITENPSSAPTADDLAYTKIQLTPRRFVGFCKLSNMLMGQAGSVIEAEIRADLGGAYVESRNSNMLVGTGVGGYPLGVLNRATGSGQQNMNTVSLSGAANVAFVAMESMISAIRVDKNPVNDLKWAMNPADWYMLTKVGAAVHGGTTVAGTVLPPLFSLGDPSKGIPPMLKGYPVVMCDDLTAGTIALGYWPTVYVGSWSGVSFAMSDVAGNAFEYDQTYVRMIYDMDVAVAKPSAICTGTSFSF